MDLEARELHRKKLQLQQEKDDLQATRSLLFALYAAEQPKEQDNDPVNSNIR